MLKRVLLGLMVLLVVGIAGFFALAYRPEIAAIAANSGQPFTAALVAKGEVLAGAGNCASCHTVKGGLPFAGGYPVKTAFGTIYSTNISPDLETGIGTWSEAAFARAMHEGVARDGSHLYPVFPYDHFTKVSDDDVKALYAYMMTREPAAAPAMKNELIFPLNIRALQEGWKILFFRAGRFVDQPLQSAEWNRGAYLAQGIAHCGACHTPRNLLGAEIRSQEYAGAAIDHWYAPPLTKANPSPVAWDQAENFAYLRTAISNVHGTAVGPMSGVIHDGLARLPDADIAALALYFTDVSKTGKAAVKTTGLPVQNVAGAHLYAAACASCHYNSGDKINPLRPDLAVNSATSLDDPSNLIQVILHGVSAREGAPEIVMPAFGAGLSDQDIAHIANYLRSTYTRMPAWDNLEKKIAALRAISTAAENP